MTNRGTVSITDLIKQAKRTAVPYKKEKDKKNSATNITSFITQNHTEIILAYVRKLTTHLPRYIQI